MFTPRIVFHSSRCALKLKPLLQPLQMNHTSSVQPAQEVESVLPLYSASSNSVFFPFSVCPRLVFNLENFHSWYLLFSYSNFPLHMQPCLALLPVQVYAAQFCAVRLTRLNRIIEMLPTFLNNLSFLLCLLLFLNVSVGLSVPPPHPPLYHASRDKRYWRPESSTRARVDPGGKKSACSFD